MSYTVERMFFKSGARAGQPNGQYLVTGAGEPVKLPSVTTIIKAGLPAPQLVRWALETGVKTAMHLVEEQAQAGISPEDVERIRALALAEPDRFRDEAADVGTRVHDAIERYLQGEQGEQCPDPDQRVRRGFRQFLDFWKSSGFELLPDAGLELPVASLQHGYAGTVDCLALDQDFGLCLMDWKTSKGIYDSHEIQAVAYAQAVQEMGLGQVERIIVARFGRDDAQFESREIEPTLWDGHLQQFLRCQGTRAWQQASTARYYERMRRGA